MALLARWRASARSVAAALAVAFVVGCETGPTSGPVGVTSDDATRGGRPDAAASATTDVHPPNAPAAPLPDIVDLPPELELEPEVDSDPQRLLGMAREAVTDLLGPPAFVRNDAPAELWRYRASHCLLDLFLYETLGVQPRRVRVMHYTVQANGGADRSAGECLRDLLLARASHAG